MYFPRCVRPVTIFLDKVHHQVPQEVPCGKCVSCRLRRASTWALRSMMELETCNGEGSFLTLTYDESSCPLELSKRHVQLFLKRFRHTVGKFRYLLCGEYGEKFSRPHYHILLFGLDAFHPIFDRFWRVSNGRQGYLSDWKYGFVHVSPIVPERAMYVAKYTVKKYHITSKKLQPPFLLMSRRPGLGYAYLLAHSSDIRDGKDHLLGFHSLDPSKRPSLPREIVSKLDEFEDLYSFDGQDRLRQVRREIEKGLSRAHFELDLMNHAKVRGVDPDHLKLELNSQLACDLLSRSSQKGKL